MRLQSMKKELKKTSEFDYLVINDELKRAVAQVNCIIDAEECRLKNLEEICFE